jgi:hypothetical protein
MDREGSDNETRDTEEDAGQRRSRTVRSEVINPNKLLSNPELISYLSRKP